LKGERKEGVMRREGEAQVVLMGRIQRKRGGPVVDARPEKRQTGLLGVGSGIRPVEDGGWEQESKETSRCGDERDEEE
jgi:hypothetical protein